MNNKNIIAELREIYLFSSLNEEQLRAMLQGMHELHLLPHERLFEFGQPAERFYYLVSGQVKLFRVSADGDEKVLEVVQPGKTFAEAILFMDKHQYPVSAEALEDSVLYSFGMMSFRHLLEESRETCFALMADMSRRLHLRVDEINQLTLKNATYRLVSYLLEQVSDQQGSSIEISLDTPKNVIASRLSIQPETFSRILARLKKQGILSVEGNRVHLLDLARMQGLLLK